MNDFANRISEAVELHREAILAAEKYIWNNPEPGYREFKTSKYLSDAFEALGYELTYADGITGFYTVIDTGRPGPEIMVLAELDAVTCPDHEFADAASGVAHACGHHAQSATLLGVAAALREPGMLDGMSGRIRLCAVPSEEMMDISSFLKLKEERGVRHLVGKREFLARGYFDGVDLAFMVHTEPECRVIGGMTCCIMKRVTYKGVSAHSCGHPELGVNALYAANGGLSAVNAIRETFVEAELMRVAPVITYGGASTCAIPDEVTVEYQICGRTYEATLKNAKKIDRALIGAAFSLGVNIEIETFPAFSPLENDRGMIDVFSEAAELVMPEEHFAVSDRISTGSTDLGDLSCVMPVVHPGMRGDKGRKHTGEYEIIDPVAACVTNAKWQIMALNIFLADGGKRAKQIVDAYKPAFESKEAFLRFIDTIEDSGDRIVYHEDGTATIMTKTQPLVANVE